MKTQQTPLQRLRHHVTGAIERDEAIAIPGQPSTPGKLTKLGKQWITQTELDAMQPTYYDLGQTAITENATWHFCGTNAWFKTSGN